MQHDRKTAVLAGLFVVICAGLMLTVIAVLARRSQIFREHYELRAKFHNVRGLREGAPVRIAGVVVGSVGRIELAPPEAPGQVLLHLRVQENCRQKVRDDSVASIRTLGPLGDKYVEITVGAPGRGRALGEGDLIATEEPMDFYEVADEAHEAMRRLNNIAVSVEESLKQFSRTETLENLDRASESLARVIEGIEKGPGALHTMVFDPEFGKLARDLKASMAGLRRMIEAAEEEGGAARLLLGNDYQEIVRRLREAADGVQRIVLRVEKGRGLLHDLVFDEKGRETLQALRRAAERLDRLLEDDLAETARSLRRLTEQAEKGDGLLHALLYDREEARTLAEVREAVKRLDRIMARVERGEGTLGLLIGDPSVWENIRKVLGGVQRSRALRYLIGRTLAAAPEPEPEPPPLEPEVPEEVP